MFFFNFKTYHPYWETLYIQSGRIIKIVNGKALFKSPKRIIKPRNGHKMLDKLKTPKLVLDKIDLIPSSDKKEIHIKTNQNEILVPRTILNYNLESLEGDQISSEELPTSRSDRQRTRTAAWKSKQKQTVPTKPDARTVQDRTEVTVRVMKASKEKLVEEPLWMEGPMQGSQPLQRMYALNADFSTFPLLLEPESNTTPEDEFLENEFNINCLPIDILLNDIDIAQANIEERNENNHMHMDCEQNKSCHPGKPVIRSIEKISPRALPYFKQGKFCNDVADLRNFEIIPIPDNDLETSGKTSCFYHFYITNPKACYYLKCIYENKFFLLLVSFQNILTCSLNL